MGQNGSKASQKQDAAINTYLKKAKAEEARKIKLLLLGAGESGKSTIFKQMKILYGEPPTTEEREHYTTVVYNNTTSFMKMIVDQAKYWNMADNVKCQEELELVFSLPEGITVDNEVGTAIQKLWQDEEIQAVWKRRSEFQVADSMRYFMKNIERIMADDYLATPQDFVHTRVRTTEIVTANYDFKGVSFEWYDVGGQRNQRRKWVHCFDDVTCVVYVAALSEYDQTLYEETNINRMTEALELFEDIANIKYFKESAIIVFLNKHDLFVEKLKIKPLEECELWADYNKGQDVRAAEDYFKKKFEARCPGNRKIYFHVTTATSTTNIKFVFDACFDIILDQNLSAAF